LTCLFADVETLVWSEHKCSGDIPPPLAGHTLTYAAESGKLYLFGGAHRFSDHTRYGTTNNNGIHVNGSAPSSSIPNTTMDDSAYPINNPSLISTISVSVNKWPTRASGHIHYPMDARKDSTYASGLLSPLSVSTAASSLLPSTTTGGMSRGESTVTNATDTRSSTLTLPNANAAAAAAGIIHYNDNINDYSSDLYALDPKTLVWSVVPTSKPPLPRCQHSCDVVEGKLVVFGGRGNHYDHHSSSLPKFKYLGSLHFCVLLLMFTLNRTIW
jgi:hypothetical protein